MLPNHVLAKVRTSLTMPTRVRLYLGARFPMLLVLDRVSIYQNRRLSKHLNLKLPVTSNGVAPQSPRGEGPPKSNDLYEAAQLGDLGETQRAYRSADSWRRIASAEMIAIVGLILVCIVLATRYQHDVLVYRETSHGLSYQDEALQTRTPSQLAIEAQLGAFIKAVRNVPGIDYALVDQNVGLALQMTVDAQPAHAHSDMVSYFSDRANNPKLLGKDGEIRTVIDPIIASPISASTWTITWAEETSRQTQRPARVLRQGTVTIAQPVIPSDPQMAAIDPAGVEIVQFDLHL
jgi:type IV secretory pathway TrbF-like protein